MLNPTVFIKIAIVATISLLGSFLNDYYNTITGKESRMRPARILIGSVTGAFFSYFLLEYFPLEEDLNLLTTKQTFFCFVSGIGGFNIFPLLQNISWSKVINIIFKNIAATKEEKE